MSAQVETQQALNPIVQTLGSAETVIVPGTPATWHKQIDAITISNITALDASFTLYLKETGETPSTANAICVEVPISANTIYQLPIGPLTIPDGWELTGLTATGDDVNVTVTGRFLPKVDSKLRASAN